MEKIRQLFVTFLCTILGACATSFKIVEPDQTTGMYKSRGVVNDSQLIEYKTFPKLSESKYVYLKAKSDFQNAKFQNYMDKFVKSLGFDMVMNEENLSIYVVEKGLTEQVTSVSDFIGLSRLAKIDGQFIYIDTSINSLNSSGCCVFVFNFKVYDRVSRVKYLDISRRNLSKVNFDKEIIYPVLNKVKEWKIDSAVNR